MSGVSGGLLSALFRSHGNGAGHLQAAPKKTAALFPKRLPEEIVLSG